MGAGNSVVAGQAACRYSLMSPSQRVDFIDSDRFVGQVGSATGGWPLVERAVRPVGVVVLAVVDDEALELALVPDDDAVEEFAADCSDPAFCDGVGHWAADGGLEDLEAFGAEDLVEGVDELAASVADQRPCAGELVGMAEEQVAGGRGGPGAGGVGGEPGEVSRGGCGCR